MKIGALVICVLLTVVSGAAADTVYLKDGTLVRGKITQEDENSIIMENKDTWKKYDKNTIDSIRREEQQLEQAQPDVSEKAHLEKKQEQREDPIQEQERNKHIRRPLYFGIQVPMNMIKGDFDGQKAPALDSGIGFGFTVGYAFTKYFALEVDWAGSSHASGNSTVGFGELSFNGKLIIPVKEQVQPYIIAGWGQYALGDSSLSFTGTGYSAGIGVDVYVHENVSIGAAVIQRVITYDHLEKIMWNGKLYKNINGDTSTIRLDLTLHF